MGVISEADAAQATHDQLSALATTFESMAAADGMSDTEAALFGHAREAIVAGTPLEAPAPAMESFGTAAARLNNAQVALEDVNSKLKAAADWVKKTIKEFLQFLATTFQRWASAIDPTIEKMQSRDYSILDSLTPNLKLELELSDTQFLSIRDAVREGSYLPTLTKIEKWVGVFTEDILPKSNTAVEQLVTRTGADIDDAAIKEAISAAYRSVEFQEENTPSGPVLVSKPLFGGFRFERRNDGYVKFAYDLGNYGNSGSLPVVTSREAEEIRNLSVKILQDLKVMTEVGDWFKRTFESVEDRLPAETQKTVVRAVMSNARDVAMKFYREVLACVKTIDQLVVSSMKEAAERKDKQ